MNGHSLQKRFQEVIPKPYIVKVRKLQQNGKEIAVRRAFEEVLSIWEKHELPVNHFVWKYSPDCCAPYPNIGTMVIPYPYIKVMVTSM